MAHQLTNYPPQPQSLASTDTGPIGTNASADRPPGGYTTPAHDGDTRGVFRLRQVHVAFGGRLSASWDAAWVDHDSIRGRNSSYDFGERRASNSGGRRRGSGDRDGVLGQILQRRRPCAYSWAIVRTRCGEGGGDGGEVTSSTGAPHSRPRIVSAGVVQGPDGTGGEGNSNICRMVKMDVLSPWKWHRIEAETDGWLPGDLMSLWAKVDDRIITGSTIVNNGDNTGDNNGNCAGNKTRAVRHNEGYHTLRDSSGDDSGTAAEGGFFGQPSLPPRVRGFVLRGVDDVRSVEIAGRVRSPHVYRRDDGRGSSHGSAFSSSSSSADCCRRLDFAAVCPMNMAAAGGSWQ